MADVHMKALAIIVAITAASAIAIGAGYAINFTGTTSASSHDYEVHYVVVVVDNNASGSLTNTFHFNGPKYYTDTEIPGSTTYRTVDYNETSQAVAISFTGANTVNITMNVKLTQALPSGSSATLQFYNGPTAEAQTVGNPVTLSTGGSDVSVALSCSSTYYCKVTVDIPGQSGLVSAPSAFDLDITFTASATTS